jgi:hypothetical protein
MLMMEVGTVHKPGQTNLAAFADLVELAQNYDLGQEVPYHFVPSCTNSARNSNGFVAGLLTASDKTVVVNYPYPNYPYWNKLLLPGGDCPVSADRFD